MVRRGRVNTNIPHTILPTLVFVSKRNMQRGYTQDSSYKTNTKMCSRQEGNESKTRKRGRGGGAKRGKNAWTERAATDS